MEKLTIVKENKKYIVTRRIYEMVYKSIGYEIVEDEAEETEEVETETVEIEEVEQDLEALTVPELKELAKAKGLEGYSDLKKAELVEELKGV